jgi:hypothetical protein
VYFFTKTAELWDKISNLCKILIAFGVRHIQKVYGKYLNVIQPNPKSVLFVRTLSGIQDSLRIARFRNASERISKWGLRDIVSRFQTPRPHQ